MEVFADFDPVLVASMAVGGGTGAAGQDEAGPLNSAGTGDCAATELEGAPGFPPPHHRTEDPQRPLLVVLRLTRQPPKVSVAAHAGPVAVPQL